MTRLTRAAVLTCAPVVAVALAACGSDSSSTSTETSPSALVTPSNVTAGNEDFCAALATFDNTANVDILNGDSTDPGANDASMEAFAQQLAEFNQANASTMPADVKPTFEALSTNLQTIISSDDPQNAADAIAQVKNAAQIIGSLRTISTWTQTNCGFEF